MCIRGIMHAPYHEGADIYQVINKLPLDTNRIQEFNRNLKLKKKYSKHKKTFTFLHVETHTKNGVRTKSKSVHEKVD